MPDIIYYDLNKFPIEFVLATYNEVSREPFTYADFCDEYKSNEFKIIIAKDSKEKITETLKNLNKEYHKEFLAIIKELGGDVHDENTSKALAVCRTKYQTYFERLQDLLNRHYEFYGNIKKNGDVWVESQGNFVPLVSRSTKSIIMVKCSVVLTILDEKNSRLKNIEVYDDSKHKLGFLKMFLDCPTGDTKKHYLGNVKEEIEKI